MKKQQAGFTLIELVVVIVLLGILGAAATARFQNLAAEARAAAIEGIAAEIASGSSINYAGSVLGTTGTQAMNAANVCTDTILGGLLQDATILGTADPARYSISGTGNCSTAGSGGSVNCTITDREDTTVTGTVRVLCTG
jgi:MSHA pilin protein MshA